MRARRLLIIAIIIVAAGALATQRLNIKGYKNADWGINSKPLVKTGGFLSAIAGLNGNRLTIKNCNDFDWEDVLMRIPDYDGFYDLKVPKIHSRKTFKINLNEFTWGIKRFNPVELKPSKFLIYCKTPPHLLKSGVQTDIYGYVFWAGEF